MKGFYSFALLAVMVITACSALTVSKPCVPVSECPLQNNLDYTVHVAYKDNCHKFYKCNGKCGYLMDCPLIEGSEERLVFNKELQVCDWPSNVPEGTCAEKPVSNCNLPKTCPVKGTAKIAHEQDCHKYYLCANGEKLPLSCEDGIFDPVSQTCDTSGNTKCQVTGECNS